jgi:type I restriction enzyme S subunit
LRKVKLEEIFEIARGGSPRPIKKFVTKDPNGINWIKIGDTTESKYITYTKEKIIEEGISKSRYVEPGDFLLTNSMSFGRPYILKIDGCIHDGWLVLKPKSDQIFEDYIYYILGSPTMKREFKKKAKGTTVKNLNISLVSDVEIPLPSLSEQKAIVATLDRAQRLIDIDKEMLAKYDELIQSVFLEMFGDPVTNSFKDENTFELEKLVKFKGGGTPSKKNEEFWNGNIPWVSPKDMKWTFIDDSQDKITSYAIEESSTKLIKNGAVLAVVRSGILKNTWPLAINVVDVTLNQDMKALICSDRINNYFLLYYLKNYSRKILGSVRGTTADNISTAVFKKIPIKLPKLNKQFEFMRIVKAIEKEKSVTKANKSEELFSSLVQRAFG